ncbi:hypothetical protein OJ253_2794 [Cryptosporidium canis]|uniref:Uncharacterized protein n=1 Tax=Cryptosporidium canis TaxID=195482 RepID=A0A9D5HUX2_9CRYT|nr:hypothetical protein OJ253_2794 [Cryptosporidium canis]
MFLSTINRLREEQVRDNSLKLYRKENSFNSNTNNVGEGDGRGGGGEKCANSVKISKRVNIENEVKTDNVNGLKELSITKKKPINKAAKSNRKEKISSFQQILNIAMASRSSGGMESCTRGSNKKPKVDIRTSPDDFTVLGSIKSDSNIDTEQDCVSTPKINFVRVICSGRGNSHLAHLNNGNSVDKKRDSASHRENDNKGVASKTKLNIEDSADIKGLKSTSKQPTAKRNTKKNFKESITSADGFNDKTSKPLESGKTSCLKPKRQNTDTPSAPQRGEKTLKTENTYNNLKEQPETYKQNILTLKAKNNLIKNRIKEQTDDDFFSNIPISTPSNSNCRTIRKSFNCEQSPSQSIFSPNSLDARLLKTGLTPVNNEGPSSGASNNKVWRRKDLAKKGLESFHLSPISSYIKEIVSGEDTNRNSSYSKSSTSRSIGDILGGLDDICGSKAGRISREKQNKFVMQIHEKLSGCFDQDEPEHNQTSQNNITRISQRYKTTTGSSDIRINLDSVFDQEMEIRTKIADEEKQQELLWSISEDSSIQNEDKSHLMEELIAHTAHEHES